MRTCRPNVRLQELGVPPDKVLISNKLAWKRVPLTTPEPTFEPGVWVNLKNDAVQDISCVREFPFHAADLCARKLVLGHYFAMQPWPDLWPGLAQTDFGRSVGQDRALSSRIHGVGLGCDSAPVRQRQRAARAVH